MFDSVLFGAISRFCLWVKGWYAFSSTLHQTLNTHTQADIVSFGRARASQSAARHDRSQNRPAQSLSACFLFSFAFVLLLFIRVLVVACVQVNVTKSIDLIGKALHVSRLPETKKVCLLFRNCCRCPFAHCFVVGFCCVVEGRLAWTILLAWFVACVVVVIACLSLLHNCCRFDLGDMFVVLYCCFVQRILTRLAFTYVFCCVLFFRVELPASAARQADWRTHRLPRRQTYVRLLSCLFAP